MENPVNLTGKAVLVTGGGKGIGKGISECFLAAGADVVICGRAEPESLPQAEGRIALFTPCDVRDIDQVQACVDFVSDTFGRLDVLVNNAGINDGQGIEKGLADFIGSLRKNLFHYYLTIV